jgi:hypothetical protein
MAKFLKSFFKLSGRLDLPAYPGFIVMKIAISGFNFTVLPIISTTTPESRIQRHFHESLSKGCKCIRVLILHLLM